MSLLCQSQGKLSLTTAGIENGAGAVAQFGQGLGKVSLQQLEADFSLRGVVDLVLEMGAHSIETAITIPHDFCDISLCNSVHTLYPRPVPPLAMGRGMVL